MANGYTFVIAETSERTDIMQSYQLEASRLPPPQPATPPTAPPPPAPPRARLQSSPLPVRSPAPNGRLSPPPRPPPPAPPPPPCSSAVPEPVDAEADVTPPPPPSPMEVVATPPHLSIPSGGARPGQVFHGGTSSAPGS
ncbi:neural Wiskott-Aldrich syndrome protein-like [Schistocerca serialis cubense]|uniref:neural Wiskott-Aldrich syndrome protein-like n=1 Tax=Schistocerca serialis cubense TaxID=2023355 RepID=UPI00214F200D|nr:neural Wiskott-Aldrich syndrome protein-like [Schistocerca serialis cubense]